MGLYRDCRKVHDELCVLGLLAMLKMQTLRRGRSTCRLP